MRPKLTMLDEAAVSKIIAEGFALLMNPGIKINNNNALKLLSKAGADINFENQIARIPEDLARRALETAPSEFYLYNMAGEATVHYGGNSVQFDPGSSALMLLDSKTKKQRKPNTADFVKFIKLVETLPQIDAQSTALIPADVPEEISDLYRLYLALNFMHKPIITGAFRTDTWRIMKDLLAAVAGSEEALAQKPIAIFDVCPTSPLKWSNLTCQNLLDCAHYNIPAQIVSMPLTGATAPVTLAGAVVQHTAECLSGVTISQLAKEGTPIVWGGSPAAFDMNKGTTPMGAVETWMIDAAYTQVGKTLGMPTHAYLGMTDSKVVDAQSGLETSGGMLMAALAGVNMISGAGMMSFENCQSYEKLVIDAEIIGMAKRLIAGIEIREDPIALPLLRELGHNGNFIAHDHTYQWFRKELHIPSPVIDRQTPEAWEENGSLTSWDRAKLLVNDLLETYQPNNLSDELRAELRQITTEAAQRFGMDELPPLP